MSNCITKVPLGTIYLYQGLDENCKPVWNYADNGSGGSTTEIGTPLRKGDSVIGSDKLSHVIDEGFINSVLDIVDTNSLDLSLVGNDLRGDVNPLWVKSLLYTSPSTYINLTYNQITGVIGASLNTSLLFSDYFSNLQIGAFAYGATFLVGVDDKKYTVPAQTVSYENFSKRLYISNGNFAVLPLTALELSSELNNLPNTTDAVYGSTLVLGKDNAWHKLPTVSGGGSGTDSQTLSITGNTLSISNGNFVTLPSGGVTTNEISSFSNTLSSTVNGVSDTTPIINSNQININQGTGVTSIVNGVASTQSIQSGTASRIAAFDSFGALIHAPVPSGSGGSGANTNDLSSSNNTLTSNVDGHVDTAPIINSNQISINQTTGLTSVVNGVSDSQAIGSGVAARMAAFDSSGALIHAPVPSGGGGSGVVLNDLSSSGNVMTSNVNGLIDTSSIVNSVNIDITPSFLTSNVNGMTHARPILTGTPVKILGFDSSNVPITVTPASLGGGSVTITNDLSSSGNTLTSTVNGQTDTAPIVNSVDINITPTALISNVNGMTYQRPISTGTPVKILGFDSSNVPITVTPASLGGGGGITTNDLSSSGNTLTSTVNGQADTAPIINSSSISLNGITGLSTTVNGVPSNNVNIPDAGIFKLAGFDINGTLVKQNQLNAITSANQRITTTVNGVAANLDATIGTVSTVAGWNSTGQFVSQNVSGLGGGGTSYTFNDTSSVDLVTSGTTITANVKKSSAAGNSIIENGDGLYSPSTLSDLTNPSVVPQGVAAVMGITDVLGKDLKWRTLPSVSGGGGTDSQTLSIAGNTLSISNGNSVTLPSGGGGTDSQTLSIAGNTLSISNGNSVTLPSAGGGVSSNTLTGNGFNLTSNVNGIVANLNPLPLTDISKLLGYNTSGNLGLFNQYEIFKQLNHFNIVSNSGDYTTPVYQQLDVTPTNIVVEDGWLFIKNGLSIDTRVFVFPQIVASLSAFGSLPSGVNEAFGEVALEISTVSATGPWTKVASSWVSTTRRVSPPPPSGYPVFSTSSGHWEKNSIVYLNATPPEHVEVLYWRLRVQVFSGVISSIYAYTPTIITIGIPTI